MDGKKIEFSKSIDPSIDVITGTTYLGTSSSNGHRAITIFHDNEAAKVEMLEVSAPVLVKKVIDLFHTNHKTVLWDYNCNYTHQTAATDLTGVGGITRSGRCYAPDMAEKVVSEKLLTPASEGQPSKEKERPSREKKDKEAFEGASKLVTVKEACEFLKFIKHSEYSVIK